MPAGQNQGGAVRSNPSLNAEPGCIKVVDTLRRTFARSLADHLTAGPYVRAAIARRRSTPRRIGVAYRVLADDDTLA